MIIATLSQVKHGTRIRVICDAICMEFIIALQCISSSQLGGGTLAGIQCQSIDIETSCGKHLTSMKSVPDIIFIC